MEAMNGHDRNPVRRNTMNTNTIDSEKNSNPEREAATAKGKRTTAKKTKPVRKAGRAKKSAGNPKADRANKRQR